MEDTRLTPFLSILGLLGLWVVAALLTDDAQLLPTPWALLPKFAQELASGELLTHLGATIIRVLWAFVLAMSLGTAIGLAMGRSARLNRWLDPWLVIFLNLPALVLIVLCYPLDRADRSRRDHRGHPQQGSQRGHCRPRRRAGA